VLKRGRKSAQEKSVVIQGEFGRRPEPPEDLNERQQEIWRETVASEAADFFLTAALRSLLADYCRHRESAETISSIVNSFKPEWLKVADGAKRLHSLLKMRDMEMRAAHSCATKLRMTNQSRYTPKAAATAANRTLSASKPWDILEP